MAIGPVQLIVLGFEQPDFHGEIIAELERLRESDTVRVIDALAVYKDAAGEFEVEHLSTLSAEEAIELGSKVGALVGLGIAGEEGFEAGAEAGAVAAADRVQVFSDEDAWDVLEEIPNDSAAALVLIEHHWAVPLRDAVMRAGGSRIADGFISPLDLVEIGLVSAEEAERLHAQETAGAAASTNLRTPTHLIEETRHVRITQSRTTHPAAAPRDASHDAGKEAKWPRVRLRATAESSALPTKAPTQSAYPCASATSARGGRAARSAGKRDFRSST